MSKSWQPYSYRAMGQADLVLPAAAANRVGDGLPDDATEAQFEERQARHIYRAAFNQGFEAGKSAGVEATLNLLTEVLMEQRDSSTVVATDVEQAA